MGMLHRIVDILKLVDENNEKWIELKLHNVDKAQKNEFKKVLTSHLDDYGRKLGIIRDSIYGIDIQALIKTNSNLPFFVASPKLFALMNDSAEDLKKEWKEIGGKQVQVRKIPINGKDIEVVKLGDIADVKVGLQTGDNNAYLFQNSEARGTYRSINDYKEFLLTEEDLEKIRNNNKLRLEVIDKGISKDNPKSERYFGGRYIIPHELLGGYKLFH